MVYKLPVSASPYIMGDVRLNKSSFRNDLIIGLISKGKQTDASGGSGVTTKEVLQCSMGEYLERLTQRKPSHLIKNSYLYAFNINTDECEKIPIEDVILYDFSILNSNNEPKWRDSTGTAFHKNSFSVIESAFFEFIERQSLVFNWLTQSPGRRINIKNLNINGKKKVLETLLRSYFSVFDSFEISIHSSCYVVITIGIGEYGKSVGLGVGWDLESAVYKSQKETLQFISKLIPSHQQDINPLALNSFILNSEEPKDMYYAEHFNNLSTVELQKEYLYLYKDNLNITLKESYPRQKPSNDDLIPFLANVAKELNIEFLICYIPSLNTTMPGVVAKLVGKGAFPHIKTDEIDPYSYTINGINKLEIKKLPNYKKMVPFS